MILQLKLGRISRQYFLEKFGVDILVRFAEPFQRLKDWGFLEIAGDQVKLTREALLQVDKLLHEFFLPEHRDARYA
jgi:oxygen-independent coproporphyrinogen-3 oxidase